MTCTLYTLQVENMVNTIFVNANFLFKHEIRKHLLALKPILGLAYQLAIDITCTSPQIQMEHRPARLVVTCVSTSSNQSLLNWIHNIHCSRSKTLLKFHCKWNNILRKEANWFRQIIRKNCHLHDAKEGQITDVKGVERKRRKQLPDDLRNRRRYWSYGGSWRSK